VFIALVSGCSGSSDSAGGPGAANDPDGGPDSGLRIRNGGNGTDEGDSCSELGATRVCCEKGKQTCGVVDEFASWGPCIDTQGTQLVCHDSDPCGGGEFGETCDAGTPRDAGHDDAGVPPPPSLCKDRKINNEPEILAGYSPADGESVSVGGQIKVWITDEHAAFIAPGEQLDPTTGAITMPGDRGAKASDGYLYEPALYIAPDSAEKGGKPYFPSAIKGPYNNAPDMGKRMVIAGAPIDPAPAGVHLGEKYDSEDVWNVSDLGLSPGTYIAEFVIHDGDEDRGVGCVTIVVTP
jgi:hypothetical protein